MRTTKGILLKLRKQDQPTALDDEIKSILDVMNMMEKNSEEYPKMLTALERLHKLKAQERPERVSRDTMAVIAGNLAGIFVIVSYEHLHVITSKGMSFIKPMSHNTN